MKKSIIPHSYIVSDFQGIEHLLTKGDNKEVLPLFLTEYQGKIDFIYLDPPYNTGNSEGFKYMDKRSNWLEYMKERLILAKPLMSDIGFLFISINEHEFAHLKILCDEIFGAQNFVSYLVWKKKGTGGIPKCGSLIIQTEFILIYAKHRVKAKLNKMHIIRQNESWRDFRKTGGNWQKKYRLNQCFPIYYNAVSGKISLQKSGKEMVEILPTDSKGELGFWMNSEKTTAIKIKNGLFKVVHSKRGSYNLKYKKENPIFSNIGTVSSPKNSTF
jgi:adenine-specific DNA-methyltransferase